MDRTIIVNWNSRVTDRDDVYILGDFSHKSEDSIQYLRQLKGQKHLIIGNHDARMLKASSGRTYDDERRRLESWLGDYMRFRQPRLAS